MQIDIAGMITWTPSEAQGGTTNLVQTRVTDNGIPALSVTNNFTVVVLETNSAPVLGMVTDQVVAELSTLAVTNVAIDGHTPANTLSYALLNAPGGMSIDTNGVITWTPTEAQGPGTNVIETVVTDNGQPALSVTNSFTAVVLETIRAPALGVITNQTLVELTTMLITNLVTDSDLPINNLTYALVTGPVGAVIDTKRRAETLSLEEWEKLTTIAKQNG